MNNQETQGTTQDVDRSGRTPCYLPLLDDDEEQVLAEMPRYQSPQLRRALMLRTLPCENARTWLQHNTHGHVAENANGLKARCGGPSLCEVCKVEKRLLELIDEDRAAFESECGR